MLLALRYYGRELARLEWLTAPAMLLPALGNIGIHYIAPLIVAKLVGRIAARSGDAGGAIFWTMPYVLTFAGVLQALFFAQTVAFDPDGITVHSLGTGASFTARTRVIPWADVSALSSVDPGTWVVRVHLKGGRPLPRPRRGLARHTATRVNLEVSGGGVRGSVERQRLITAVRHFASHVDTGLL